MNSRRRRDDGFHENSFSQLITSPFRYMRRLVDSIAGEGESMRQHRGPLEMIGALITLPFRLLFAFAVFMVQAWTTSRNGYAFVRAIPAILAAALVFALVWAINFRFEKNIAITHARYMRAVQENPETPEVGEMYAEKLLEFRPDDPLYKYYLGLMRERLGRSESSRRLMNQLASEDEPGYASAHVWLGKDFAFSKDHDITDQQREAKAIKHYNFALETEPENLLALVGMADVFEKKGDLETASSYLTQIVNQEWISLIQLQVIPKLVDMQQKLGKEDEARQLLRFHMDKISSLSRRIPDIFEIWVILVQCATMLKDYDQAAEIINDGYQTAKSAQVRESLVALMATVQIIKADDVESIEDKDSYQERLFALCDAIKTNPRSRDAYTRLIEYAAPETLQEEKSQWLRESIIGCPNPAVIHVILGMQEIKLGDFVQGQKHWRIADEQSSASQYIVNNMIELAVTDKPEVFGNLLDMITVAMELFPEQAALYQTRGMYYKNNQQYPEAIKDLKYAAEKIPTLISARTMLMDCYQAVGDEENSAKVQLEIDRLVVQLDESQKKMVEDFLKKAEEERKQKEEEE